MQTNTCPVFNNSFDHSAKYNHIMGRDVNTHDNFDRFNTTDRFNNFDRFNTMDRFNNFNMMNNGFNTMDRFNNWDNFDRFNMWNNRFNMMDRFNTFDRFNMMDRFNNWENFDRFNMMNNGFNMMDRFNNFDRFNMMNRFNGFDRRLNRFDELKGIEMPATWLHSLTFRPSHYLEYYTLTHPIHFCDSSMERAEIFLCFDLRGFTMNEIKCTFDRTEQCIKVEAMHDVKDGDLHHVMRSFSRKFFLPAALKTIDLAKCGEVRFFVRDGLLHVTMALPTLNKDELHLVRDLVNTHTVDRFDRFENTHMAVDTHKFNMDSNWFNSIAFRPATFREYYTLTHPIRFFDRTLERAELFYAIDLTCFKKDEITVTFDRKTRCIVIEATHRVKDEKKHHVDRDFRRKIFLPATLKNLDLTKCGDLKTNFTEEGVLFIHLGLPRLTREELMTVHDLVNTRFTHHRDWEMMGNFHPTHNFHGFFNNNTTTNNNTVTAKTI